MKKSLFTRLLILIVMTGFFFGSMPVFAQDVPADKKEAILELLRITEINSQIKQTMDEMFGIIEDNYSEFDACKEFINEFKSKYDINEVIELLVPIYSKYYTYEDIKEMIKFYKSPIGQKMISAAPGIDSEAIKAGAEYADKVMKETESYKKIVSEAELTACKCNIKNTATALEMYACDHEGKYAPDLKSLIPEYLKELPVCPVSGNGYVFELSENGENYILYCPGEQHKDLNITGPAWSSKTGLVDNVEDAKGK
ncbi:MAG: DUF2059 domain-containing protein [Armatimonadota bacterium]